MQVPTFINLAGDDMPETSLGKRETVGDVTIVSFGPEPLSITEDIIADVSEILLEATHCTPPKLVVDLEHVEFFSSTFIETLFRVWNRMKAQERGAFALCNLHPYCLEILTITNLHTVWNIYDSREAALAAMSEEPGV
jgi:anti-sigma B factor antagonist